MVGIARSRRIARRHKRAFWAAALCSASFLTSQVLFGDDQPPTAPAAPSLLSQYLDAKSDLVSVPADNTPKNESASTELPPNRRLKPVVIATDKAEEPSTTSAAVEPVTTTQLTAQTSSAGLLRPAAVSAAANL